MRPVGRRTRRALTVAALSGGIVLALPRAAGAHALVRTSQPPDGAVLSKPPSQVVVTFTEPPDAKLSFLHVVSSSGAQVESGPTTVVPGSPLELRVPLPPSLPNGAYTVVWRTVSRVDGHVTGGSLSFGVGVPASAVGHGSTAAPTTPPPPPLGVVGRWLFYWGLAVLLGGAVTTVLVFRPYLPQGIPRAWILLVAAWCVAVAGLAAMVVAELQVVGVAFGSLLSSSAGREFLQRGIAIGATGALVAAFSARPRMTTAALVGLGAAATMLVHVLAGHAAANARLTWFNVAVQWTHVVAVAVWIGGLVWLLLAIRSVHASARGAVAARFSATAAGALAVVALTGLSRALDEVGWPDHWGRLFDTSFGITVLIKVGLFALLVGLGALNRFIRVPKVRAGDGAALGGLRRTVTGELVLAALIFAATGVMTSLPPAASVAAAARPATSPFLVLWGHDFATTARARLTVTPGTVGPNRFRVLVTDFDSGRPVGASSVGLTFALPSQPNIGTPTLPLRRSGPGVWTGQGTTISMFGTWDVEVLVQERATSVTVPLRLTPRLPPERIQVSSASGQPTLFTVTLLGGGTMQGYIEPGRPGNDTVHFTFFDAKGDELPIASATAVGGPGGSVRPLPLIRFSAGHFVANTVLTRGSWRFVIQANPRSGQPITAYFNQTIT